MPLAPFLAVLCVVAVLTTACTNESAHESHPGPADSEYIDIRQVPVRVQPKAAHTGASTGTWQSHCGRNEDGHHNADNVVIQPGIAAGAHHVHDYVGNLSTDAFSTDESLAKAGTTCRLDDRSTYYWPVLRLLDEPGTDANEAGGGADGNHGRIVLPDSVLVQYRGSPVSNVVAMPRFLRAITGNPVAVSQKGKYAEHVQWTCSGERERMTNRYPRCPEGQQLVRVFDFPRCWDGKATDSKQHRSHVVFPVEGGACPVGTFPVPQLHIEVTYSVPSSARYAIDSFPEERRSALTDHGVFISVLPDKLMKTIVTCLNRGTRC